MRAALCVVVAVLASGASSVVGQVAPSIRQFENPVSDIQQVTVPPGAE